jgi:tetratricopeptide (TPR) repeat protein
MVSLLLQTQQRAALYYLNLLRQIQEQFEGGAEAEGLAKFVADRDQILHAQATALDLARQDSEGVPLAGDLMTAGRSVLKMALTPRERITTQITALDVLAEPEYRAHILINLSTDCSLVGDFDDALAYSQAASALADQLNNPLIRAAVRTNLGTTYLDMRQPERAKEQFSLAQDGADVGSFGQSAHLNGLGNTELLNKRPRKAIPYFEQALAIAEHLNSAELRGAYLLSLSIAYLDLRQYNNALDYAERALEASQIAGDERNIGAALGHIGNIYYRKGDHRRAIEYYLKASNSILKIDDRLGLANRYNNLGRAYLAIGNATESLVYLEKARDLFAEMGISEWVESVQKAIDYIKSPTSLPPVMLAKLIHTAKDFVRNKRS